MFTSLHSANGIIYYNGIVISCIQNANLQPCAYVVYDDRGKMQPLGIFSSTGKCKKYFHRLRLQRSQSGSSRLAWQFSNFNEWCDSIFAANCIYFYEYENLVSASVRRLMGWKIRCMGVPKIEQ